MADEMVPIPKLLIQISAGLMAMLVAAFGYWATTVDRVGREALVEIREVGVGMSEVQADLKVISARQQDHEGKPWHEKAGDEIRELRIKAAIARRNGPGDP